MNDLKTNFQKIVNDRFPTLEMELKDELVNDIYQCHQNDNKKSYDDIIHETFLQVEKSEKRLNKAHKQFGVLFVPPINSV